MMRVKVTGLLKEVTSVEISKSMDPKLFASQPTYASG
jgi:hypothetical protein